MIKKLNWEVSTDLGGICQDWNLGTGSTGGWSVVKLSADYPLVRKGELTGNSRLADGMHCLLGIVSNSICPGKILRYGFPGS